MKAFVPVIIHLTAIVIGKVVMAFKNEKTDTQTQGEAMPTTTPCPDGVSG